MSRPTCLTLPGRAHPRASGILAGVVVSGLLALTACGPVDRLPAAPRVGDVRSQRVPHRDAVAEQADSSAESATDPSGDTLGSTGAPLDLTALTVTPDSDAVVLVLDFAQDLPQPVVGASPTITGLVELDLDQDSTTGHAPSVDILHRFLADGGTAGMGADAAIGLAPLDTDSTAPVYDASYRVVGRVKPVFAGRRITIRVPRPLLANDDGRLGATVLIGNGTDVTDYAPSVGHFTFGSAVWPSSH
jgi:hypothetical protein